LPPGPFALAYTRYSRKMNTGTITTTRPAITLAGDSSYQPSLSDAPVNHFHIRPAIPEPPFPAPAVDWLLARNRRMTAKASSTKPPPGTR
jgi:hypothetical protein